MKTFLFLIILSIVIAGGSPAAAISTHTFTNCNFPDTGQTASYTFTFGEDHDYNPSGSQPGYTTYNPGGTSSVTVDNRTGLMWVTNPVDAGFVPGPSTWEVAISSCETLNYAGYTDWRLPNIRELVSIANYSRSNPAINTVYFLNTQNNYYWSSTTYMPSTSGAWYVHFGDGLAGSHAKTSADNVTCVRGGP